jgi:Putative adhesin
MKGRSIVGPLVLILLGAAFLINNVRPDLNLFTFLSNYWPFLLIGMGALRLLEVLVYAATAKPLATRGFSGGEIFLVILIVIIGTGMFEARKHLGPIRLGRHTLEVFGESFDYTVSQQKAIGAKSRILFDNVQGNVRVTAADAAEIKITGRKTIRAYNKADADKVNEQCPLEIIADGDRVIVRTNQEKISEDRKATTDLEVTVPRGVSIEGHGRTGDFDITGIGGGVEISSDNSGVRLNKLGGNVKVDVRRSDLVRAVDVAGSVEVTGRGNDVELENIEGPVTVNGAFGGNLEFKNIARPFHFESRNTDLRVERLPGRISMDLAALSGINLVGPVTLTTKSKDVKLEEFTQSLQLELERGDIELRPHSLPLAKIDARSRNVGNMDLALPAQAKFELTATTDKGEVRNDYGPAVVTVGTEGRSPTMKSSTGGGPLIQVSTARGTVTVRKE